MEGLLSEESIQRAEAVIRTKDLEIQAPIIIRRMLQFQSKFPAPASFMSAPNEDRLTNVLVHQIHQIQLLSHRKSLRHHPQPTGRTDVHSPSLRPATFSSSFPFNLYR